MNTIPGRKPSRKVGASYARQMYRGRKAASRRDSRRETPNRTSVAFIERYRDVTQNRARLESLIVASRHMLELTPDWDDEGAVGYLESTWERAVRFISEITAPSISGTMRSVALPKITPGPEGSIDIRWKEQRRTLLVNFPADDRLAPDFFGSDRGVDSIKGTLDLSSQNLWLLIWLTR